MGLLQKLKGLNKWAKTNVKTCPYCNKWIKINEFKKHKKKCKKKARQKRKQDKKERKKRRNLG